MTSYSSLINRSNISLGFQGIERDPSGITDVISSAFHMQKANYNSNSQTSLMQDIFAEDYQKSLDLGINDRLKELEVELMTPETKRRSARVSSVRRRVRDEAIIKGRTEDPENFSKIRTSKEAAEEARKRAQLSMQEFQEVSQGASGVSRIVGGFVGGSAGSLSDPITVASIMVGAGTAKNILNAIAIEAAINAGSEALMQPGIYRWQKELGQEYGFSDAAVNIISAGVFGGAVTGVVRGARPGSHFLLEKAANSKILPKKARAAAKSMANFVHIKEANPSPKISKIDDEAHYKNIDTTIRAFEEGRAVSPEEIYVGAINPQDNTGKGFFDQSTVLTKAEMDLFKTEQARIVEDIRLELMDDLNKRLSRGDRKKLKQELRQIEFLKDKIEIVKEKPKKEKGVPARKAKKDAQKLAEKLAADEEKIMLEKEGIIKRKLKDSKIGQEAQSDLSRLDQGVIPERFRSRVDQAYNNAIANRAVKKPEVKQAQQKILEEQGVTESDVIEVAGYEKLIDEAGSDEVFKAAEAEFKRMLKENPDLKVTDEDGNTVSIKQMSEELREEDKVLKQITNCAMG